MCSYQGLGTSSPVRSLRYRLVYHIKSNTLLKAGDKDVPQTSVPTDLFHNVMVPAPKILVIALMAVVEIAKARSLLNCYATFLRSPWKTCRLFCVSLSG